MGTHSEATLDTKFVNLARQMNLYLNHFPRHEKYGLSQQIRNAAYGLYGFIIESQKRYQKKTSLGNADIAHEQLRMFLRLAFELGYFKYDDGTLPASTNPEGDAVHKYLAISRMVDEVGRMLGGWIGDERDKKNPDGGNKREAS